ncbi:MAG: magnesium transporter [Chloroflexi bacterium]|nr:MAG: magnesium transporter [Chloroflexota bacterium]
MVVRHTARVQEPQVAPPFATSSSLTPTAAGPTELQALRALNSEYIREHPEEVARFLDLRSPQETAALLVHATPGAASQLVERLNPRIAAEVLVRMPRELSRTVLSEMNPSRSAPVVVSMSPREREEHLAGVEPKVAEAIREVLSYPVDSAKELGAIYLTDADGRLAGTVPLGEIATALPETKLKDLVRGGTPAVYVNASRHEVVEYLNEQRVATLPVVDLEHRLVGVIRYRALVTAAEAEASVTIQTMLGVSKEERALSKVSFAIHQRLPWLEINLATVFLAAFVVGLFENTIARFTALAVLLPVVSGQTGNSGMQALAVTMRGLALREVRISQWPRLIMKELGVGLLNGFAVALTTMLGVTIWSHSLGLTLVIGLAMLFSMTIAGAAGAAVPLLLKAFGQDPAQSSSIVLTTITDVCGFLTFLGLATIFASAL